MGSCLPSSEPVPRARRHNERYTPSLRWFSPRFPFNTRFPFIIVPRLAGVVDSPPPDGANQFRDLSNARTGFNRGGDHGREMGKHPGPEPRWRQGEVRCEKGAMVAILEQRRSHRAAVPPVPVSHRDQPGRDGRPLVTGSRRLLAPAHPEHRSIREGLPGRLRAVHPSQPATARGSPAHTKAVAATQKMYRAAFKEKAAKKRSKAHCGVGCGTDMTVVFCATGATHQATGHHSGGHDSGGHHADAGHHASSHDAGAGHHSCGGHSGGGHSCGGHSCGGHSCGGHGCGGGH